MCPGSQQSVTGCSVETLNHYLDYYPSMRFILILICLASLATLTGCSLFRPATDGQAWPETVPDRNYFLAAYESDPENQKLQSKKAYLTWIIRFYQGSAVYRRGWNDLVPDVVDSIEPPEQQQALEQKLHSLGKKIAADWAKDNNARQITSAHLATWGQAMNESVVNDEQIELVQEIARDLDRLLRHKLKIQAIVASRYYPEDEDDVFR